MTTGTYLDRILERTRQDLPAIKAAVPPAKVQALAAAQPRAFDFLRALQAPGIQVIAEVKKASPSKGVMAGDLDPVATARAYAEGGAAAISVLTEGPHFQGKLEYLSAIKGALGRQCPPLLRKDFIVEEYQVYEARAHGADALLLIVAALSDPALRNLLALTEELGMHALVEVHDPQEAVRAVAIGARIIGINNRDLRTFRTSLETTAAVRPHIPEGRVVVSESGISSAKDVAMVAGSGVKAVLVGEALVTAPDIRAKLRELRDGPWD